MSPTVTCTVFFIVLLIPARLSVTVTVTDALPFLLPAVMLPSSSTVIRFTFDDVYLYSTSVIYHGDTLGFICIV